MDGQAFALLDYNLPDGKWTTICERIRAESSQTRVAFITASYNFEQTLHTIGLQPDALFRKPVDVNALFEWLRR